MAAQQSWWCNNCGDMDNAFTIGNCPTCNMQPVAHKFALNVWNSWTDASVGVSFKSSVAGIGDGEFKIAAEVGSGLPRGQNSPYDLDIAYEGIILKCDVKKLDNDTFNTGVNGRDKLRPIKDAVATFLLQVQSLTEKSSVPDDIKKSIVAIADKSPDELSCKTLQKMYDLFARLSEYRVELIGKTTPLNCFDFLTGVPKSIPSYDVYKLMVASKKSCDDIVAVLGDQYEQSKMITEILENPYIVNPTMFMEELNSLVSMFGEYTLIFVDEVKGFYVMSNPIENIKFMRITRGHPRFKVHFPASPQGI